LMPPGQGEPSIASIDLEPEKLGREILESLSRKGFCVIEGDVKADDLNDYLREIGQIEADGKLVRPCQELVDGLLGPEGSGRIATLDVAKPEDLKDGTNLAAANDRLYALGNCMASLTGAYLGFDMSSRDSGFLLEAGGRGLEPAPELDVVTCLKWLQVFHWHRILGLFFIGPAGGTLDMRPFDDHSLSHQIQVQPGTWVLLRADLLSHTFTPKGQSFALGCFYFENRNTAEFRRKEAGFPTVPVADRLDQWFVAVGKHLKEGAETEEHLEALATREGQRTINHMYHKGSQTAIRGWSTRTPMNTSNVDFLRGMFFGGGDAAEQIPYMRWDNDLYYVPDPSAENLMAKAEAAGYASTRESYNCEHGSFIEGIEMFDNKFFGLSVNECRGMDPNQRQLLEVCYEVCFSAGLKKPNLMRSHIGVYTGGPGSMETEFNLVPKTADDCGGALASTGGSAAILSNRLSYAFGMNGPNFLFSADSASGLLALNLATDALQRFKPQCDSALVLGIDVILAPIGYAQFCWAGLMSFRGRCLTFDHTSDGYIRGEGSGGFYLNPALHQVDGEYMVDQEGSMLAMVSGTFSAHSGKVATLSAPSGAMDQELIANTIRQAEVSPLDIEIVEAHGIGSLLNDAVEAQAAFKAYRGRSGAEGVEMLGMGCVKTNFGNGKPVAGIMSLLKVILSQNLGQICPTLHMLRSNPYMILDEVPVNFATEHVPQQMNSSFSAVTGKGFGGSCAHAIIWGSVDFEHVNYAKPVFSKSEIVYWPGGGGELEDEAKPTRSYTVLGSWTNWETSEPMQSEGRGAFAFIVTLGEHASESFQILLDGEADKTLHPGIPGAWKEFGVKGPSEALEAENSYWTIGGQPASTPALQDAAGKEGEGTVGVYSEPGADLGRPGDKFKVRLLINGKYRMVTWEREGSA